MKFLIFILPFILLQQAVDSLPLQLISSDGLCKSTSQINNFVTSQTIWHSGTGGCVLSSLVDLSCDSVGCVTFNSLLETSFEVKTKGKYNI